MKKYGLVFWLVILVIVALGVSLPVGIAMHKISNLQKELSQSQQSALLIKQQVQIKESQITQLSKKVSLLSKKLKAAANHQILSYKLKSGDTLYDLFGPSWQKVAKMNNIKSAENLPAGKIINFRGYVHRVKKGENFCKLFGDNWQRIAWLNGFCPQQAKILPAGQYLKVPNI